MTCTNIKSINYKTKLNIKKSCSEEKKEEENLRSENNATPQPDGGGLDTVVKTGQLRSNY